MPLDAALFAYAGLAGLALGTHQHRRVALPVIGTVEPRTAKLAGGALMALSILAAMLGYGAAQGIVAWVGLLSIAGVCLVLLLSRWPQGALQSGLLAAAFATAFFIPRLAGALAA